MNYNALTIKELSQLADEIVATEPFDHFKMGHILVAVRTKCTTTEHKQNYGSWLLKHKIPQTKALNLIDLVSVFATADALAPRGLSVGYRIGQFGNRSIRQELIDFSKEGCSLTELIEKEQILLNKNPSTGGNKTLVPGSSKIPASLVVEQKKKLVEQFKKFAAPHELSSLSGHQQAWISKSYKELLDLFETMNSRLSKSAVKSYINTLHYLEHVVEDSINNRMSDEIKNRTEELDTREKQLDRREQELEARSKRLRAILEKDEILFIKGCLHPDKIAKIAPDYVERYTKAFTIFNNAI